VAPAVLEGVAEQVGGDLSDAQPVPAAPRRARGLEQHLRPGGLPLRPVALDDLAHQRAEVDVRLGVDGERPQADPREIHEGLHQAREDLELALGDLEEAHHLLLLHGLRDVGAAQ
jgi:hypothetical protein